MAETDLKVTCDFVDSGEDGSITMKMETLNVTLPPLEAGFAYNVQSAGRVTAITAQKIEGTNK